MKVTLSSLKSLVALESGGGNLSTYIEHAVMLWRRVNVAFEKLKDETLRLDVRPE